MLSDGQAEALPGLAIGRGVLECPAKQFTECAPILCDTDCRSRFPLQLCGSIVGTRLDLSETLAFAAEGKVTPHYTTDSLDNINGIFDRMRAGPIDGRIVMTV